MVLTQDSRLLSGGDFEFKILESGCKLAAFVPIQKGLREVLDFQLLSTERHLVGGVVGDPDRACHEVLVNGVAAGVIFIFVFLTAGKLE